MSVRKKSIKLSINKQIINIKTQRENKEVFYLKKVRPRDLTENFGTGSAYPINNYNEIVVV